MFIAPSRSPASARSVRRTLAIGGLAVAVAAALVAAALVAGQPAVPAAQAAPTAAEAPLVPVALVVQSAFESAPTHVARIEASQRVDLQSRLAGPIDAVLFREGDIVQAGQPLFQIDPRPFDAALARAHGELALAQAREALTTSQADRARQLHADRAIAVEEFDRRMAAQDIRGSLAHAALQTARLDREFTLVRAPITGRIGRALVTAGNFVAAGANPTPLASMVSVAPLDVHFDVPDRGIAQRLSDERNPKGWKVRILDAEGQRQLGQAPVDFVHHSIDPGTGTLRLRARLHSPNPQLMPGQFVRIQLATGHKEQAMLVPDQAVGTDQGRRFVLVVDARGQVEYRPVTVGTTHEHHRVVTSGLKAGEQVVVSGLMRVRPGMTVKPQRVSDPAQAQAATAKSS